MKQDLQDAVDALLALHGLPLFVEATARIASPLTHELGAAMREAQNLQRPVFITDGAPCRPLDGMPNIEARGWNGSFYIALPIGKLVKITTANKATTNKEQQ